MVAGWMDGWMDSEWLVAPIQYIHPIIVMIWLLRDKRPAMDWIYIAVVLL